MRPSDPDNGGRIADGVLKGMQLAGYDYPVRKLRRHRDSCCVTLPLQVRGFLALEPGVWLLFGECTWPGLVAFFKVSPERYRELMTDESKEIRQSARKVQKRKSTLVVTIPPRICEILSAEVGDNLIFGLAPRRNMVTVAALKGGGDSAGSRRPG
ncbi:hypothetical protein ES707_09780 [subsurface metagenome]